MAVTEDDATLAEVKWFNPTKGFGFVTSANKSDALLHASVLAQKGKRWLAEGTKVSVRLDQGPKGLIVSELLAIEDDEKAEQPDDSFVEWAECEVKFFNQAKGYGFAVLNNGQHAEQDVFFDARCLAQADLDPPSPGQRMKVEVTDRAQGLAAARLGPIDD